MVTMMQRPASAALDLGLNLSDPNGLGGDLVNETEEQKRKRLLQQKTGRDGPMGIISPAVADLLGKGMNGG